MGLLRIHAYFIGKMPSSELILLPIDHPNNPKIPSSAKLNIHAHVQLKNT